MEEEEYNIVDCRKVVLVGEASVGKTSIVLRFVNDKFDENEEPTLGAAFLTKSFDLTDERKIKLDIWDTAGQERFRAIVPMYYRDAAAAIVVFDLTRYETFSRAKKWIQEICSNLNGKVVKLALVGNKSDLSSQRNVDKSEISDLVKEKELLYFETSAKTGDNVTTFFSQLAESLPKKKVRSKEEKDTLDVSNPSKKGGCCGKN